MKRWVYAIETECQLSIVAENNEGNFVHEIKVSSNDGSPISIYRCVRFVAAIYDWFSGRREGWTETVV